MRFDGRINLLFHFVVVLGRTLRDPCVGRDLAGTLIFPAGKLHFAMWTPVLVRRAQSCQEFFLRKIS